MEKYGFVYLWYDKKYPRYYIGAHWGTEDDGYICSSNWMRDAYKRRPQDFKRRILSRIHTNKEEMFKKEEEWLSLISEEELGVKYYNRHRNALVGIGVEPWNKGKNGYAIHSDEYKERLRQQALGNNGNFGGGIHPKLDTKHSPETRKKISKALKGREVTWENKNTKNWALESPEGKIFCVRSLRKFCLENGMNNATYKNLSGRGHAQGWKVINVG